MEQIALLRTVTDTGRNSVRDAPRARYVPPPQGSHRVRAR